MVIDLVDLFPSAEVVVETEILAFGDPKARDFMLRGFSSPEGPGVRTFVWATGSESEIALHLVEPRPLTLAMRGFPSPVPSSPPSS